jgi:HAD superfamily hydrolase (TIGR01509 family)
MKVVQGALDALLFDFDGLIIDTETPIFHIWREIFARHDYDLRLDEWRHALGTHGGFDPVARLGEITGGVSDVESLVRQVHQRHWEACETLPLLPGVQALMSLAHSAGLGLAVASSSPRDWVEPWLKRHGIRDLIGALCTREDVVHVKPAPDLFLLAAERLGVPAASCLVFEDSPNGVLAAHRAGMRCVAVPNGLTRALPLPDPELTLDSLEGISLGEICSRVGMIVEGAARHRWACA